MNQEAWTVEFFPNSEFFSCQETKLTTFYFC